MLQPIARTAEPLGARIEAAVYGRRNVVAFLPVALAWLAMDGPPAGAALAGGVALVAAGSALRAWATLYNRYAQGARKSLATGGPYSWIRNPLYVANSLVLLGGFAASGLWAWLPAALLWFAFAYTVTIRHEERRLLEKYGAAYASYRARVGRWLPKAPGERPQVPGRAFLGALAVQSRALLILAPLLLHGVL